MFKLACETVIRAKPETVYGILSDLPRYAEWNPFNIRGAGVAAPGNTVRITARLGKREMTVSHKILVMERNAAFVWCDLGWFTKFAYGERARYLHDEGGSVRYRVELSITGPLAWLVKWQMAPLLQGGMQAETDALKKRAEAHG
jgi:hypothetical protein